MISYGILTNELMDAAELLSQEGICPEVIKLDSVKPIDMDLIIPSVKKTGRLLVAEETVRNGCVGREISALLRARDILVPTRSCNLGDAFIEHGTVSQLYELVGVDGKALAAAAKEVLSDEA